MSKFCLKMTPELVQQARMLYRDCKSYRAVASAMHISRDTARRWLNPDAIGTRPDVAPVQRSSLPTLAFVPHVEIYGRYVMRNP